MNNIIDAFPWIMGAVLLLSICNIATTIRISSLERRIEELEDQE